MRALVALLILSAFAAHAQLLVTEQKPSPNGCQWATQYQQDSQRDSDAAISASTLSPADAEAKKSCSDSSAGQGQEIDQPSGWKHWFSDPTTFATLLIAIFTIVLALSTIFLYISTNKAAVAGSISADSLKSIERPWMLMDGFKLLNYPQTRPPGETTIGSNHLMVKLKWTNAGRSPAFVIARESKLFVLPRDEKLDDRWDVDAIIDDDHSHPIISGGHWSERAIYRPGHTVGIGLWEQINSGELTLILRAYIRYTDVFGATHETRYCAWFVLLPSDSDAINTCGGKEYNSQT